jgi:hypothetical protein
MRSGLCSKRGILIRYQLKSVSDAISEFNRSKEHPRLLLGHLFSVHIIKKAGISVLCMDCGSERFGGFINELNGTVGYDLDVGKSIGCSIQKYCLKVLYQAAQNFYL